MKQPIGSYPHVRVRDNGRVVVSRAGSVLLIKTVRKTGLDQAVSAALAPWRKPRAVHDPGKILVDLALTVALGRDCLADIAMLRAEPVVFGPVASEPAVSRLVGTLADAGERALTALRNARSKVRQRSWTLAGDRAPDSGGEVTVDLDGVLVVSHSDKQDAAPTWKKTYGHHPLMGFVDHGPGGSGEPVAALLPPGTRARTPPPTSCARRLEPPSTFRTHQASSVRPLRFPLSEAPATTRRPCSPEPAALWCPWPRSGNQ